MDVIPMHNSTAPQLDQYAYAMIAIISRILNPNTKDVAIDGIKAIGIASNNDSVSLAFANFLAPYGADLIIHS